MADQTKKPVFDPAAMPPLGNWGDAVENEKKKPMNQSEIDALAKEFSSSTTISDAKSADASKQDADGEGKGKEKEEEDDSKNDEQEALLKELEDRGGLDIRVHEDVRVVLVHSEKNGSVKFDAAESFDDLKMDQKLLDTVYASNFNKPSPIQAYALPVSFTGRNIIAEAPAGTGKTITFTLTILHAIDKNRQAPQAVILAPTHELATNINNVVGKFAGIVGVTTQLLIGGVKSFDCNAQILIGTPGKIEEAFAPKKRSARKIARDAIKVFVLDEADQMLAQAGFRDKSLQLYKMCSNVTQTCLFSATYNKAVESFAENQFVPKPWTAVRVIPKNKKESDSKGPKDYYISKNVKHIVLRCNADQKMAALQEIYEMVTTGQSFIFANLTQTVADIARTMKDQKLAVVELSGKVDADVRKKVFDDFSNNRVKVCVCTNVGSRGLDVTNCNVVVNYELPYFNNQSVPDAVTYVHRVGRSGRYGRKGAAINMVTSEKELADLHAILKECRTTDNQEITYESFHMDDIADISSLLDEHLQ